MAGIDKLREFWNSIGAPSRLADYGIDESALDILVDRAMRNGEFGIFSKLNEKDCRKIFQASL